MAHYDTITRSNQLATREGNSSLVTHYRRVIRKHIHLYVVSLRPSVLTALCYSHVFDPADPLRNIYTGPPSKPPNEVWKPLEPNEADVQTCALQTPPPPQSLFSIFMTHLGISKRNVQKLKHRVIYYMIE